MKYKGACYGIVPSSYGGFYGGPDQDSLIERDFQIIHRELHCNAIRIWGDRNDRIIQSARMAADEGFDKVIVSPRYIDRPIDVTLSSFSELAQKIGFGNFGSSVVLAVGNELTVDVTGIYDGWTYDERVAVIRTEQYDKSRQSRLERLLRDLISIARKNTDVDLTYAAGSWEWMMPWDDLDLDILGDNHYWYREYGNPDDPDNVWFRHVRHYKQYEKPYFITEFGCGNFDGAFDAGGNAWEQQDNKHDDQDAQAAGIEKYLQMFNKADDLGLTIDGCFLFDYYDHYYWLVEWKQLIPKPRKSFFMYKSYSNST